MLAYHANTGKSNGRHDAILRQIELFEALTAV